MLYFFDSSYGQVALFFLGGLVFILTQLTAGWLLRPHRPNEEKLTTYESGEDPTGNAWGNFNFRFYVIALIFILFEVELIFLFPWTIVFSDKDLLAQSNNLWGWYSLVEMFIFVFLLVIGLGYVWKKGFLDWEKPNTIQKDIETPVPNKLYEDLNKKVS
ncbi:MAG TPA: NADH-quinone oxidoreductase subunit A [Cyclobacteriaceae bacterium]